MKTCFLIPALFLFICSFAQKPLTEQELEKMASQGEKMAEKVMKDPRYKKAMAEAGAQEEGKPPRFPAKNKSLMATLPSRPLPKAALRTYLNDLYTAYKTKMPASAVQAVQKANSQLGNDPNKLGIAAVSNWYNGAPKEAVLMALTASIKTQEDPLLLNNLAALLNMGGAPYHALPILRTLVNDYPNNPMVLNNLGQAFAGTGELDTAMYYLGRCIKESPHHPEANNTAGQIEASRGNTAAAARYFENSLKGGYNEGAVKGMENLGKEQSFRLSKFIKPPIEQPYFNEFKYKLPRQSENADDAPLVKQEHTDFRNFIEGQVAAYSELSQQESAKGSEKLQNKAQAAFKKGTLIPLGHPLQLAAGKMMMTIALGLQQEAADQEQQIGKIEERIQTLLDNYERQRQVIMQNYAEKRKGIECGEGHGDGCAMLDRLSKEECKELSVLSITTQGMIAASVRDKQKKELLFARRIFNLSSYYGYLAGLNKELANAAFYGACADYLNRLKNIAGHPILIAHKCEEEASTSGKTESDNTKSMDCPIDLSIPLAVGKIELNCEKFSFSAGEGVTFKYEKDFDSKQSTLSIGAGLQLEAGKALGIFSGEVGASAEQSLYIVFDKDNSISDAGLSLQVELSAGAEVSVGEAFGADENNALDQKVFTHELLDKKVELGYTLGVNSGWTFNDGAINSIAKSIGGVFKK